MAKKSFKMCIVCVPSFGGIKRIGYCLELLPLQFDGARVATRRLLTETIEQSSVDYSNFPETSKWLRRLIQKKEHCDNYFITGFARSKHSTARSTQLAGRCSPQCARYSRHSRTIVPRLARASYCAANAPLRNAASCVVPRRARHLVENAARRG